MSFYKRWVHNRELRLTLRDPHRKIFPFDWGLDWIGNNNNFDTTFSPLECLKNQADGILSNSSQYYEPPLLENVVLKEDTLTFSTPTPSPYPENNTARCRIFKTQKTKSAVIVIPQWNAQKDSHVGLCQMLRRLGITAVRLCMPYHEQRLVPEMQRADYMVSPNIGRTLHATRQAVLEVRQIARWLRETGYQKIGVVGTSMGSCIAYLAFVHDTSICTGVFNHVSSFFADVVWTGLSTRYVRWGMEGNISLEDLRHCWSPISPWFHIGRLKKNNRHHLLITAKYDLTFRPELTEKMFQEYKTHNIQYQRIVMPCGHYTLATFPFKYLDGWHMCRYLLHQLK
ncbi:MAG: alpha/beta hydrolase family protein [Acidobacteriota bacterium]|nr:alpha/beta hydrolase family protein [Acidobacteriota bacterium]